MKRLICLLSIITVFIISCQNQTVGSEFEIVQDDIVYPEAPPTQTDKGTEFPENFKVQTNVSLAPSTSAGDHFVDLTTEYGSLSGSNLTLEFQASYENHTKGVKDPLQLLKSLEISEVNINSKKNLRLTIKSTAFDALGSRDQKALIKYDIYINVTGYKTGIRTVYIDITRKF